jgi:hypothetical protein
VPLLFPFSWKFGLPPIRSWRIKTGHWVENLLVFPSLIIFIIFLFVEYSQSLFSWI